MFVTDGQKKTIALPLACMLGVVQLPSLNCQVANGNGHHLHSLGKVLVETEGFLIGHGYITIVNAPQFKLLYSVDVI